jgi:Zn-dependent protease with chaperone function
MTSLGGSAFLQALGWAIAGSLWQMALLWGIYQLCFAVWRNIKASVKTLAATLLQFAGFVWFVSSLVSHYWQLKMTPGSLGIVDSVYRESVHPHSHALVYYVNRLMSLSEHYLPYLSGAYLLVLAFLLVRVVKAYRHVQVVRSEGITKIDAHWRVYVQEMAYRIGIHRTIRVWLSEKIDIPATMGYLKPLILLPIASFNHLSPEQVEAILLHELAHIKRNDYLLNLVITVVDTVLFFNPFAQLIARHIRTERENSCDDFVLQFRYNPHVYASALLSLEQQRLTPELAMAAAGKTDLLERIKRIMNVPSKPMNYGQKLMALLITAGILASLAWLTPENIERKPFLNPIAVLLPTPAPTPVPSSVLSKAPVTHHTRVTVMPVIKETEDASDGLDNTWNDDNLAQTKAAEDLQAAELAKTEVDFLQDSRARALQALKHAQTQQIIDDQKMMAAAGLLKEMKVFRFGVDTVYLKGLNVHMDTLGSQLKAFHMEMGQPGLFVEYGRPRKTSPKKDVTLTYLTQWKAAVDRQENYELRQEQFQVTREKQKAALMLKRINDNLLVINKASAFSGKIKPKAKVLDQPCLDESAGILADQPGWQVPEAPVGAYRAYTTHSAAIPVAYYASPAPQARREAAAAGAYRERVTLYQNQASTRQLGCPDPVRVVQDRTEDEAPAPKEPRHKVAYVTVNGLVNQLEKDGLIGENGTVRIVCDDNSLIVNGEIQPEAIYERYKTTLEGKNFVILATGKVVQVTIK